MEDKIGLMWTCRMCGKRVSAEASTCPTCGYGRTSFDLARTMNADESGAYDVPRLTQPSFSELSTKMASGFRKRVVIGFAAGSSAVLLIMAIVYARGC